MATRTEFAIPTRVHLGPWDSGFVVSDDDGDDFDVVPFAAMAALLGADGAMALAERVRETGGGFFEITVRAE